MLNVAAVTGAAEAGVMLEGAARTPADEPVDKTGVVEEASVEGAADLCK